MVTLLQGFFFALGNMMTHISQFEHITVLKDELVNSLGCFSLKSEHVIIDCTAGGGGHIENVLTRVSEHAKIIGIDRDPVAIEHLEIKFKDECRAGRVQFICNVFSQLKEIAHRYSLNGRIQGIYADLGISSPQVDLCERGFSFQKEALLDMRMNQRDGGLTVRDFINGAQEEELANVIYEFGEERQSRVIARAIVRQRALKTIEKTTELASLVAHAMKGRKNSKIHPATKTFQALRIFINDELNEIRTLLDHGFELLNPSGRMAIISFHSLEDRMVKQFFKKMSSDPSDSLPRDIPILPSVQNIRARIQKPFPLIPGNDEVKRNPRSRSAKLRILEKLS
jgi:16S rRNA (cytosine1402-N4)-methyltransferase